MANRTKTEGSGRKKGTPNKLTHETRGVLMEALAGELDKLPETLDALPPAQRIDAVLKLLKYILPTIEAVTISRVDREILDPGYCKASLERGITDEKAMDKFMEGINL